MKRTLFVFAFHTGKFSFTNPNRQKIKLAKALNTVTEQFAQDVPNMILIILTPSLWNNLSADKLFLQTERFVKPSSFKAPKIHTAVTNYDAIWQIWFFAWTDRRVTNWFCICICICIWHKFSTKLNQNVSIKC